jgi:hypothetical protein
MQLDPGLRRDDINILHLGLRPDDVNTHAAVADTNHSVRAGSRSLLLATLDVAGDAAGDAADRGAGPATAAGDGRDAGAGGGTDGRTTHRPLLLWRHVRASDHTRHDRDGRYQCNSFHH